MNEYTIYEDNFTITLFLKQGSTITFYHDGTLFDCCDVFDEGYYQIVGSPDGGIRYNKLSNGTTYDASASALGEYRSYNQQVATVPTYPVSYSTAMSVASSVNLTYDMLRNTVQREMTRGLEPTTLMVDSSGWNDTLTLQTDE